MTKLSDVLLSPKTTLPALLNAAGAPSFFTSILVPLRESCALLPQAIMSQVLSSYPSRHRAWRIGFIMQIIATVLMLVFGLSLTSFLAGIAVVSSLTLWSLSRALCSLTNKDIQGKHIDKGNRGTLIGSAATISSTFSIMVGILALLYGNLSQSAVDTTYIIILGFVAMVAQITCLVVMWPLKTVVDVSRNNDTKNETSKTGGKNRFKIVSFFKALRLKAMLDMSTTLKTFIYARSFMSNSALMAPIFTLAYTKDPMSILAWLVIAQASAGFVSSYVWGRVSDKSALLSMQIGAILAFISGGVLLTSLIFYSQYAGSAWFIVSLFFILNIGHNGVRTGRKIYSVDIAEEHERTDFVAKSNTYVGSFILLAGAALSLLSLYSLQLVLVVMIVSLLIGVALTLKLPKEK